ncbi:MAG: SPOR domain-containing protein [Armatimonadota bacterium]|nr:SPOR domain-containing protein [Armatimonadota bacterium]MDW8155720.1 SPOR domain-containing protein [Armatimonadota bacterium]
MIRLVDRVLDRHGVVGRVQTVYTVVGYKVTSGPVRTRTAAEQRRRLLETVGLRSQVHDHPDGYVLDFGQFRNAPAAERLARAIRSRGYGAAVRPVQAASYAVVVGPVAEKAAAALARTLDGAGVPVSLTRHHGGAHTHPR